ncbi:MAG TPA: hypothetical protein VF600_14980 [Abditibacteriaceae bacterium]
MAVNRCRAGSDHQRWNEWQEPHLDCAPRCSIPDEMPVVCEAPLLMEMVQAMARFAAPNQSEYSLHRVWRCSLKGLAGRLGC